jgi:hypothetical protein
VSGTEVPVSPSFVLLEGAPVCNYLCLSEWYKGTGKSYLCLTGRYTGKTPTWVVMLYHFPVGLLWQHLEENMSLKGQYQKVLTVFNNLRSRSNINPCPRNGGNQ